MAYGKTYTKRPYRKSYGKVSKSVKKYVSRVMDKQIEDKIKTGSLQATFAILPNVAWSEYPITNVSQGIGKGGRIGNKIRVKSVEINGVIAQGSNELITDDAWNVMRIILGLYNGVNTPLTSANLSINDVMRTDYSSAKGTLRQKYLDKYVPLNVVSTEQGAGDGYTPQVKLFKYYKRFKRPILIEYADDAVTYPNKALVLSMISDSVAVTHPGFINGWWCVTYEDA